MVLEYDAVPEIKVIGKVNHGSYVNMHDISKRIYSPDGISATIHTSGGGNLEPLVLVEDSRIKPKGRIRKYTELETWRIMDIPDEHFNKAKNVLNENFYNGKNRSSSQLRKQAGNGIAIGVLEHIFRQMLPAKTHYIKCGKQVFELSELAEKCNLPYNLVERRYNLGWSAGEIIMGIKCLD